MSEACQYCGRFMKRIWYQSSDESDSWQDFWKCSLQDQHIKDYPDHFYRGQTEEQG